MALAIPKSLPNKILLIHEWFSPRSFGGAEQVVRAIDHIFTTAGRIVDFAALVDSESSNPDSWISGRSVQTSFIQNLPCGSSHVQQYLPFLPFAIEQLDISDYPLVVSSNHLVAKGVLTSPDQLHVSYIHTPVRYAWDQMHTYLRHSRISRLGFEPLIRFQLHHLRKWDYLSSKRPDYLISNSRFTARRISRYWGRESEVIHPPVDVDQFRWDQSRDEFYLCLSRLVPNKRVDLVVQAFNLLGLPLLVVGQGPEADALKGLAGPTVQLLGYQSQEQVKDLMAHCRAFVYAGIEDFGIAPVEAMASGAPVIAFRKGGLLDTVRCAFSVKSSPTGILFPDQQVSSLVDAVTWFEDRAFWRSLSSESIRLWAERFRPEVFSSRFETFITESWLRHQQDCAVDLGDLVNTTYGGVK